MKSVLQPSKTLVSGSATTRDPGHTICTRNTERCRERRRWMLYIKIWQPGIAPVLGRFMYGSSHHFCTSNLSLPVSPADPQSRRDRKDRRCQTAIPQATSRQKPEIPSTSPRRQAQYQVQVVRRSPPGAVCLGEGSGIWFWREIWRSSVL